MTYINEQTKQRIRRFGIWMVLAMTTLIAACATVAVSGTDAACDALRPYLPTVSSQDTQETRESALVFYDVFTEVCK